jgi:hypothetical protein
MQVLGRIKVTVDGNAVLTEKGAKISLGGAKRTPVVASDGSVHHSEEMMEATVEFSALMVPTFDPQVMHNSKDVTINFLGDNGIKYVMSNGISQNPPDVSDDGKCAFSFFGDAAQKQ